MRQGLGSRAIWLLGMALALGSTRAESAGPYSFYTISPCRSVDTRSGSPLVASVPREFVLRGICGVPSTAKALAINVTVVTPGDGGWLKVYPSDVAEPVTSNLNFDGDEFAIANAVTTALSASGTHDLTVKWDGFSGAPSELHLVIDVSGYYE